MAGSTPISDGSEPVHPAEEAAAHAAIPEKESAAQTDLWIFREGKKSVSGPEMLHDLERRISAAATNSKALLDALIQAGELEAALADAGSRAAEVAAKLTDDLALALCTGSLSVSGTLNLIAQMHPPDRLSISPPEGFTYYALHPLDFAKVIAEIPEQPHVCALIGIRSIGTTLSAVTAAALKQAGRDASRITVRPTGHPYSRKNEFNAQPLQWIHARLTNNAQFLITDEGPGRSGSTFLSVAESLVAAGVPKDLITIIGSRQPDPASLYADDAIARWNAFRFIATTPSVNSRFEGCTYIGGGDWRKLMKSQPWPESWTQMERLKFLSADKERVFKFEGMGPIGAEVRERAFALAKAGLAPRAADAGDGFLEYEWLHGERLTAAALTPKLLDHMSRYCAFRAGNLAISCEEDSELHKMVTYNVQQEFGVELHLPDDAFATPAPILADGRMQPHEWIAIPDGQIKKTDGTTHGDDHFFPGPCDVAWDLAGIAIEWQLERNAREYLVQKFQHLTGRDVSSTIDHYILAYAVFRLGFCKMAISTVAGPDEEQRLRAAYLRYRDQAALQLRQLGADHRSILAA